MNIIRLNIQYIKVINSCDHKLIGEFVGQIYRLPGGFTKKRYLWNLIRGKDFYLNLASYVVEKVRTVIYGKADNPDEFMEEANGIVKKVIETEKSEKVRRSFVWNVTKHVPLVTIETIQYMSQDRLRNILADENGKLVNDDVLQPFIERIMQLRQTNNDLHNLLDMNIQ